MKLTPYDLARLAWGLGLGLALASLGLGAALWGTHQAQTAAAEHSRAAAALQHITARRHQAEADASELRESGRRFQRLVEQGFFTPTNRLEWVEQLRQARQELGIPSLAYEFQPQRVLEQGQGHFLVSRMGISLGLNHEMELEPFLARLAARSNALILARACDFSRAADVRRDAPPRPGANILAHCQLDWITGRLPSGATP